MIPMIREFVSFDLDYDDLSMGYYVRVSKKDPLKLIYNSLFSEHPEWSVQFSIQSYGPDYQPLPEFFTAWVVPHENGSASRYMKRHYVVYDYILETYSMVMTTFQSQLRLWFWSSLTFDNLTCIEFGQHSFRKVNRRTNCDCEFYLDFDDDDGKIYRYNQNANGDYVRDQLPIGVDELLSLPQDNLIRSSESSVISVDDQAARLISTSNLSVGSSSGIPSTRLFKVHKYDDTLACISESDELCWSFHNVYFKSQEQKGLDGQGWSRTVHITPDIGKFLEEVSLRSCPCCSSAPIVEEFKYRVMNIGLDPIARHPNIYLSGEFKYTLTESFQYLKLFDDRGCPTDTLVGFMRGITDGVSFMHQHGKVHGGLKPDNVVICESFDSQGEAVYTAKIKFDGATGSGSSPEDVLNLRHMYIFCVTRGQYPFASIVSLAAKIKIKIKAPTAHHLIWNYLSRKPTPKASNVRRQPFFYELHQERDFVIEGLDLLERGQVDRQNDFPRLGELKRIRNYLCHSPNAEKTWLGLREKHPQLVIDLHDFVNGHCTNNVFEQKYLDL